MILHFVNIKIKLVRDLAKRKHYKVKMQTEFQIRNLKLRFNIALLFYTYILKPHVASAISVTLYENPYYKGRQHTQVLDRCQNVREQSWLMASSVKTCSCVVIYLDSCCQGKSLQIHNENDNLSRTILKNAVSSFSPCGLYQPEFPKYMPGAWFDHGENMRKVIEQDDSAIYHDNGVDKDKQDVSWWHADFISELWAYTKHTYGDFGPDGSQLMVFVHGGKSGGSGGLNSISWNRDKNCRNIVDINLTSSDVGEEMDRMAKEVAAIVQWSARGVQYNVLRNIWPEEDNSPFVEIFTYDAYLNMDLKDDVQRVLKKYSNISREYPREESYWFRDWFYPIYQGYGGARVLNEFFQLVGEYFPKQNDSNKLDDSMWRTIKNTWALNFGEFVHFMSGAAGFSMQEQTEIAFDWRSDVDLELLQAERDFPKVVYQAGN